jgi:Sel1 repeat
MYFNGIFRVHKDETLGLEWMMKAADGGYDVALYEMGRAYEFGRRGATKDKTKAIYWYEKAAERSSIQAQYWLAENTSAGMACRRTLTRLASGCAKRPIMTKVTSRRTWPRANWLGSKRKVRPDRDATPGLLFTLRRLVFLIEICAVHEPLHDPFQT